MKSKKYFVIGILFTLMHYSIASGMPVFDGGNFVQNMQNFIKQMAEMKTQAENQVKQLKELESQVTAMTGNRDLGKILQDETLKQLPDEWESVYNDIETDYKKLFDPKQYNQEDNLTTLAKNYEYSEQAYKGIVQGFKRIEGLMDRINQTKDVKAAQDLQNRISIEQANIQNNQMRLDMMERIVKQEREIRNQRSVEYRKCVLRARIEDTSKKHCTPPKE